MRRLRRPQSPGAIFAVPVLLGLTACAGLFLGLVGDGAWDAAAWIMLGFLPAALGVAFLIDRT